MAAANRLPAKSNSNAVENVEPEKKVYTQPEKAAVILMVLGRDDAAPLLKEFNEEEVRSFARASASLSNVESEDVEDIVAEFVSSLSAKNIAMNADRLKELLSSFMSDDAIERVLEDLDDSDGRSIWEKLSKSDPADLANFLAKEHPQTIAVVLSRIKPDSSAQVLQRLEKEVAEEVIMRIANVSLLSPQVMEKVKQTIETEFLRNARLRKSKRKPDELIGSMFNFMASDKRDSLLQGLEERSPELAQAVQRKMFTFGDIPARVERASVSFIMREIENEVLLKALAFATKNAPESTEFFLSSMSKRLAEQFQEQISEMPAPNAKDGEAAQFEVIGVIRKMAETGEIELKQPEDEEIDGE